MTALAVPMEVGVSRACINAIETGRYERRKTIETFFYAETRDLAPSDGGAVVA